MYKAKIVKINSDRTLSITIPSLKIDEVEAHGLVQDRESLPYLPGDLVIVGQLNDHSWVVIGLVYKAN